MISNKLCKNYQKHENLFPNNDLKLIDSSLNYGRYCAYE